MVVAALRPSAHAYGSPVVSSRGSGLRPSAGARLYTSRLTGISARHRAGRAQERDSPGRCRGHWSGATHPAGVMSELGANRMIEDSPR